MYIHFQPIRLVNDLTVSNSSVSCHNQTIASPWRWFDTVLYEFNSCKMCFIGKARLVRKWNWSVCEDAPFSLSHLNYGALLHLYCSNVTIWGDFGLNCYKFCSNISRLRFLFLLLGIYEHIQTTNRAWLLE